jgi:archaemetzincin
MKKSPPKSPPSIGLIEMGRLGDVAVRLVAANLQAFIGIPVDILPPLSVPSEAFQPQREQYDAGVILKKLAQLSFPGHVRILALTTVDLCSPILTYVYGQAEISGRVAVVSNFRLRSNEGWSNVSPDHYYGRLAKVSLHEIAHTLSLYHCDEPKCLMHFSPGLHHLDKVEIAFCERCEFMLRESLGEIRADSR